MKKTGSMVIKAIAIAIIWVLPCFAWAKDPPPPPPPDISTQQAYECATQDPNCYILDVRTAEEWIWVGHPGKNKLEEGAGLDGKVVNIPWYIVYQNGWPVLNPSFLTDVNQIFGGNPSVKLVTICRSGVRSVSAAVALIDAGYQAYNTLNGFEGQSDSRGYRTLNGWKIDGLPYTASRNDAYPD